MTVALGIDFGTSGARSIAIDTDRNVLWQSARDLGSNWRQTLFALMGELPATLKPGVTSIAIDGTSGTVLLCDRVGRIIGEPLLYADDRGQTVLDRVREIAPAGHGTIGATSSLAKLLWLSARYQAEIATLDRQPIYFLHQADWLAAQLHGKLGISDYHNALKLGYEVESLRYPDWLENCPYRPFLPQVLAPGESIGYLLPEVAQELGLPATCLVKAGTTDSIAALMASEVSAPGTAVTSLGSTLVVKLLSRVRVDAPEYGIYSHRWGDRWLVGGASNTGGAVLRHFFSDVELASLSAGIDAAIPTPLDYYPLLKPGERFPINDPQLAPRLEPRPATPVDFLHGLLEGIARIEARGYQLLVELGATPLTTVYTAGGGAKNSTWTQIRQRYLPVPVAISPHQEAAYGAALLALGQVNLSDRHH